MDLLIAFVLLAIGLAILIGGAEALVRGASSVGRSFGISPLVIGLTIVAFGTSAPELTVNLYSAFTGATDLAVGNIVGSNIANVLLILGVTAVITPLAVQSSTVKWEIPFALLAMILVFVFGNDVLVDGGFTNIITRSDGIAFLGLFAVFMFYVFALVTHGKGASVDVSDIPDKPMAVWRASLFTLIGLAGLVLGGKILVDQAVIIASLAGLSQSVIGLTVVAIGTSLPELATSIVAALKNQADIAIGNVIGSNIFNVFWILGLTAIVAPLQAPEGFMFDSLVAVGAMIALVLALFTGTRHRLDRFQGVTFVVVYIAYIAYLVM